MKPRSALDRLRVGIIVLGSWIFAPLFATDTATGRLRLDLPYVAAGHPLQTLDLRVPDGAGPFPVVVLVHGGGWSSGDKSGAEKPGSGADITPWFEPLETAGFLAVSINYRLAPDHRWPACLEDTRAAVAWVRAHIAEHGGDPKRIAIMGHSAGGHLALLAAMPVGNGPEPVQAVVGCAAVSDFVADLERRGGASVSLQALFAIPAQVTPEALALLRETSPLNHLAAAYPPTLLLHGDADKTVPIEQSRAFQRKAREAGVSCDLVVLPGAGHRLTQWTAHDPAWAAQMTAWLHQRLDAAKAPKSTPVNNATKLPLTSRP